MSYINGLDFKELFLGNNKLGLWIAIAILLLIVILVVSLIILLVNRNKPIKVDYNDEVFGRAINDSYSDASNHIIADRSGASNQVRTLPTRQLSPGSKTVVRTVTKSSGSAGRLG